MKKIYLIFIEKNNKNINNTTSNNFITNANPGCLAVLGFRDFFRFLMLN